MRTQFFRPPASEPASAGDEVDDPRGLDAGPGRAMVGVDDPGLVASAEREQLAVDIAAIENATAMLRRAEPALDAWSHSPPGLGRPRPVWLLIGVLWLSAALVTLGAVVTIATLVG